MPRYISIDIESGQLFLSSVDVRGGSVQLEKALAIPAVGGLTAILAADLGKRIKEAMKEAGIAPAPLVACIGRERVVLKEIKYPASVGAAEEPALVRFQVSKELAESGDGVVVDYFALPALDPDGQRRALAFAFRKDILAVYRTLSQAAGLKLIAIAPRTFGIAASLMRAIKDGAVTPPESAALPIAVLVRGDKWGELVILRGGQVAFTRSLTGMALNSEAAMLGEIRRNLAVFAGQLPQNQVQCLFVAESDVPGGWSGRVRAGLAIPVQSFDPIAGVESDVPPETHGCFAGLTGLAILQGKSSELPINFIEPREPKPVSDPNKRLLGLIAVAASLIFVVALGLGRFMASQKADAALALQNQKTDLEEEIKKLDDVVKRVKAVRDWEDKNVNWLDELYDLTARFPDPAGTEVVQLSGKSVEPGKNATTKYTAEMELQINTEAGKVVDDLSISMAQDRHYSVGGKQSKGAASGGFRNRKNQQYLLKVQIERREPNQYVLKLNAAAPTRQERNKEGQPEAAADIFGGFGVFGGMQ